MARKIGIIGRIGDAAEQVILSRVKNNSLFAEYHKRSEAAKWTKQATLYQRKEIKDWTNAVMSATDPENPRRGELMRFYQSLLLDPHLSAVIDTRTLAVQRASYKIVNEKGEENDELKALLERPWHDDLIRLTVGKNFVGTTLIELFDTDPDTLELRRVSSIPQTNFIPQRGIVVNEEYDDDGTSYTEGRYKDFYVQVGGDYELGQLNELAMVIMAKKLGLGSWMSYIEKFGVPPVFAITERMDTGRRDELFEMMANFRMNHFAVLQGKEKIEVPNNYNVDAYKSFQALKDTCNQEISKRILGGTAMVDEKSFVGAAEVQERVAEGRFESDKLLYKHYFNTQYRQRLAKLSSVYAAFATHTLVWDNQETLDINGYIDAIEKLSGAFDFDVEEIRTRTGLPIIGMKAVSSPEQPGTTSQKKSPDAEVRTYQLPQAQTELLGLFAATWDAAIERLADDIYSGKVKTTDLDKDLVLKNYAAFNKEAKKAWGKGYYDESLTRDFRENFLKFAGAKAHDLMKQLDALNTGKTSKEDFTTQAKAIVNKHNDQWLNTETKFAGDCVSSAQEYASYLEDIDIYGYLKYRTMGDGDVRAAHAANEGIIVPVKEVTALAPFDYGCRCWWEQTTDKPTKGREIKGVKFSNNPHKTGEVFNNEQSYFKNLADNNRGIVRDNTERMKQYMPYNQTITVDEQTVFVSDFHHTPDVAANIKAAKLLAKELEQDVYILPHVENSDKLHMKNPELGIGKPANTADLKTFDPDLSSGTRKFIANNVKAANKQGCKAVVFDLSKAPEANSLKIAADKLRGDLKGTGKSNIKKVFIIKDGKVLMATRKHLGQKNYLKYFETE